MKLITANSLLRSLRHLPLDSPAALIRLMSFSLFLFLHRPSFPMPLLVEEVMRFRLFVIGDALVGRLGHLRPHSLADQELGPAASRHPDSAGVETPGPAADARTVADLARQRHSEERVGRAAIQRVVL